MGDELIKKQIYHLMIILMLVFNLLFVFIPMNNKPVSAGTLTVGSGGAYATIALALAAADAGDIVQVFAGTYNEVDLTVPNGVWLVGNGSDVTILEGTGAAWDIMNVNADNIRISDFNITKVPANKRGIYLDSNTAYNVTIQNCTFFSNTGNDIEKRTGAGIIRNCTFHRTAGLIILDEGIGDGYTHKFEVYNNSFTEIAAFPLLIRDNVNPLFIYNNDFLDNTLYGVFIAAAEGGQDIMNISFYQNIIRNNPVGLVLNPDDNVSIYDNVFENTKNFNTTDAAMSGVDFNLSSITAGNNVLEGSNIGGNYWHDYTGTDGDGDGIGDTTHTPLEPAYGGLGTDHFPLVINPPTNVVADYDGTPRNLNLTWTTGANSDTGIVVKKAGSYPSSATDGTEVYNGTDGSASISDVRSYEYYSVFSYNSNATAYSTGVNVDGWGIIAVHVFNESKPSEPVTFDIFITDETGSQTYEALNVTNTHYIDVADVPYGDDTIFLVEATNYKLRTYYKDLEIDSFYNYTFYLPPLETFDEDENTTTDTNLYVVEILNIYYLPVDDCLIDIKRYINTTGDYEEVFNGYTDGNGKVEVYLIPNEVYKVGMSKSGYVTKYENYIPDPDYYGLYYPKTFTIYFEDETNITTKTFGDICTFTGVWNSANKLEIYYHDIETLTVNCTFLIYESYNKTLTRKEAVFYSGSSTITFTNTTNLNSSRLHRIQLNLNHTTLGEVTNQTIYVNPLHLDSGKISGEWVETSFENVFGSFAWRYVYFFFIFAPAFGFVLIGGKVGHPGLGVLAAVGYITIFMWNVITSIDSVLVILISLGVLIGVITILSKKGRKLMKG